MGHIKHDLYLPVPNFALKINDLKPKGVLNESLEPLGMFIFRNRNIIENSNSMNFKEPPSFESHPSELPILPIKITPRFPLTFFYGRTFIFYDLEHYSYLCGLKDT